jgi:hypothetical protein
MTFPDLDAPLSQLTLLATPPPRMQLGQPLTELILQGGLRRLPLEPFVSLLQILQKVLYLAELGAYPDKVQCFGVGHPQGLFERPKMLDRLEAKRPICLKCAISAANTPPMEKLLPLI